MSAILKDVHETARGLHAAGAMSDAEMREFDVLCRPLRAYTPTQIKRIRERVGGSRDMFAAYLNISGSTVRRWERGQTKPGGASLRLLHLVSQKGLAALR